MDYTALLPMILGGCPAENRGPSCNSLQRPWHFGVCGNFKIYKLLQHSQSLTSNPTLTANACALTILDGLALRPKATFSRR